MSEQDPLERPRLGLRRILLVSGGVLLVSAIFLVPGTGILQDVIPTADLPTPPSSSAGLTDGASSDADSTRGAATASEVPRLLLPVYWLGDVDGQDGLFREFLEAPEASSGDPIADAVLKMTSREPLDPDYRSPWQPASSVSSSISTRNVITIDLSSDALAEQLDEDDAKLALQQLVYTATAAAAHAGLITGGESSSVVVLVDGESGYRAFGSVDLRGEWTRDTSVLAPVWIIDPQEGSEADPGGLTVHGQGPADQQEVTWRVDRMPAGASAAEAPDGTVPDPFEEGTADISSADGTDRAYSFTLELPPGRYEITVSAPAVDGGASDSKTVRVR